jgi:hypothetical protein
MSKEALKLALDDLMAEYCMERTSFAKRVDEIFKQALAAPVQEPVAMRMPKVGDKVVCIEDESLGTVVYLTAGGSPEVKFDDGSHGTYMLREFAELFGYTTPPAQEIVCSTGLCHYKPAAAVQEPVKWDDAILTAYPISDPEYWPDSLKVRFMEQEIAQLRATPPAQSAPEVCCGEYKTCVKACVPRGVFLGQQKASAQPAPVAWQHIESAPKDGTRILCQNEKGLVDICEWTEDRFTSSDDRTFGGCPAYTSWTSLPHSGPTLPAAQRPWVGLTDEQKLDVVTDYFDHVDGDWAVKKASQLLDAYEAKLKEKNT